jgi:hypothetical protein
MQPFIDALISCQTFKRIEQLCALRRAAQLKRKPARLVHPPTVAVVDDCCRGAIMNGNKLLVGAGVGVAMAYLFDPSRGRRRRALLGDQIRRASRKTRDAIDTTSRDVGNRAIGIVAATRGRFARSGGDGGTLVERVRAKLGRVCSHPRAIDVQAGDGHVTLRGAILASEVRDLLTAVASVRGVRTVSNELEAHDSAEGVPALQGTRRTAGPVLDILQRNWAPGTRAVVTAVGFAATGLCLAAYARRD